MAARAVAVARVEVEAEVAEAAEVVTTVGAMAVVPLPAEEVRQGADPMLAAAAPVVL